MKYKVFGCKVNKYYTDKWLLSLKKDNKTGIFIATCVVTDKAKKKWIKFIIDSFNELKESEMIYISGCGTLKNGKLQTNFYKLYPELIFLKNKLVLLEESPKDNNINYNIPDGIYTKKFLVIQGGCDNYCTFCLTVKKRGKHFSINKENIIKEILDFELKGGKEIVLTGINLCAWGLKSTILPTIVWNDYNRSIRGLLKYILNKTNIPRIRISSLGPEYITEDILKIFENKRIYPHFHFSIQSGSTKILKSMARQYDGEYINKLLLKTKSVKREDNVDISLGADIIIGFPGETESDFLETYNLIQKYKIQKIHAFPFSAHTTGETVPAGSFKNQIPEKIKKERMEKISKLGDNIRSEFIKSQKGKPLKVLIESVKGDNWKGWSENYIEATNDNFKVIVGNIKRNEIIEGWLI